MITIDLPSWLKQWKFPAVVRTEEEAMALAIEASRRNVEEGTGGPFGAVVVDASSGKVISVGVNLVVQGHASVLHAEMVALTLAQQKLEADNLGVGGRKMMLYSSSEPCAMCMGAIPWSGVKRLTYAAHDEDVRGIGFDEGDKPRDWEAAYGKRGIEVRQSGRALREKAVEVLREYKENGGVIY